MTYQFFGLRLDTDFTYRIIRESEDDMDIFLDVGYRCVDLNAGDSKMFHSRIQFPYVRSMILRIARDSSIMTVHVMRDIDLMSAFANFEIDFSHSVISIKNEQEKVVFDRIFDPL